MTLFQPRRELLWRPEATVSPDAGTCPLLCTKPGRCGWCGRPLAPRARRWCSDACADAWHTQHDWKRARAAALRRDGERCVICSAADDLEVHHDPPAPHYGPGCHHHLANLTTLCRPHHKERHLLTADGRR